MGESTNSLDDPPSKNDKESENTDRSKSTPKEEKLAVYPIFSRSVNSNLKKRLSETDLKAEASDVSPIVKSRYGRTHKPKISEDFLATDKKVGAILGLSPKKSPSKTASPNKTPGDVQKVNAKARKLSDFFAKKESLPSIGTADKDAKSEKVRPSGSETPQKRKDAAHVNGLVKDAVKSPSKNGDEPNCSWKPGDLAWARVSGYPYWPCMIALEPGSEVFTRSLNRGANTLLQIHVQFFGDNGRRSWLYINCVMAFLGLEAYNELAAKLLNESKKKDKKLASTFIVTGKNKIKWDIAVQEAEVAMALSREERMQDFATLYPSPQKSRKSEDLLVIHKAWSSWRELVNLEMKVEIDMFEKIKRHSTPARTNNFANNTESSPVRRASPDKGTENGQQTAKKVQRKKYTSSAKGDFKVYLSKYLDRVAEENPQLSTKAVEKYLAKEWQEMDVQQRSK
ncbi:hypothetical protein C0J52_02967 [Blattella germanica]|nr:hypothetical protein C0J52_02967 [Blattella germanica]